MGPGRRCGRLAGFSGSQKPLAGTKQRLRWTLDPLIGWCPTYIFNFTGHPAAALPCGFDARGLPVGLQLVGRRWADADVIAASATFERLRPWAGSYRVPAARPLSA